MSSVPVRAAVLCTAGIRKFRRLPLMIYQNNVNIFAHGRERTGSRFAQTAWRPKRQVLIQCRSSGTSASPGRSAPSSAEMETLFKQIGQLQQLAQEAVGLAFKSGPQGIRRSAQDQSTIVVLGSYPTAPRCVDLEPRPMSPATQYSRKFRQRRGLQSRSRCLRCRQH